MRHCPQCKAEVRDEVRFCTHCGVVFPITCAACQSELRIGDSFCRQCGCRVTTPIFLEQCPACRRLYRTPIQFCNHCGIAIKSFPWRYGLLVAPACALVSLLVWAIVAPLGHMASGIVHCSASGTSICRIEVIAFAVVFPVALLVLLFIARRWLAARMERAIRWLPARFCFLLVPAMATFFFAIPWAWANYKNAFVSGILPHILFPGTVGIAAYLARPGSRIEVWIARASFFVLRDRIPVPVRMALLLAVSFAFSVLVTRQHWISPAALRQQIVVLIGLGVGYMLLSPRRRSAAA